MFGISVVVIGERAAVNFGSHRVQRIFFEKFTTRIKSIQKIEKFGEIFLSFHEEKEKECLEFR